MSVHRPKRFGKYRRELQEKIDRARSARAITEHEQWPLVLDIVERFQSTSESGFLEGKVTAEQHRANLLAGNLIVLEIEAIVARGEDAASELEQLDRKEEEHGRRQAV